MLRPADITPHEKIYDSQHGNICSIKNYRGKNFSDYILTIKPCTEWHQRNRQQKKNVQPDKPVGKVDNETKHPVMNDPVLPDQ